MLGRAPGKGPRVRDAAHSYGVGRAGVPRRGAGGYHHRRRDHHARAQLVRQIMANDNLLLSDVDALLQDAEDLEIAEPVVAHLTVPRTTGGCGSTLTVLAACDIIVTLLWRGGPISGVTVGES